MEVQLMEEGHGQGGIEMLSTNRWKRWLPSIPNDGFSSERCLLHVISYAVMRYGMMCRLTCTLDIRSNVE